MYLEENGILNFEGGIYIYIWVFFASKVKRVIISNFYYHIIKF